MSRRRSSLALEIMFNQLIIGCDLFVAAAGGRCGVSEVTSEHLSVAEVGGVQLSHQVYTDRHSSSQSLPSLITQIATTDHNTRQPYTRCC